MIYGHGDDLFKYNNVEINFSTNIFNPEDYHQLSRTYANILGEGDSCKARHRD